MRAWRAQMGKELKESMMACSEQTYSYRCLAP